MKTLLSQLLNKFIHNNHAGELILIIKNLSIVFTTSILLFHGCKTTYNISNFPSKEKFHQYVNDSVRDIDVEVTTKSDSLLHLSDGIEINNDTLFILNKEVIKEERIISLNEIKDINYNSFQKTSAFLELKSGEEIQAENMLISNNTISLINTRDSIFKSSILSQEIKEIKYKSRWKTALTGFIFGTITGVAVGGFTHIIPANENHPSYFPPYQITEYNTFHSTMIATVSGAFIGTIIGWLIGYDFIYQF